MFKSRLQHLNAQRDEQQVKKLMSELVEDVWKANQELVASSDHLLVPISRKVRYDEVRAALAEKGLRSFDRPPKVTFSETSLASAALLFLRQDRNRRVCIVSCGCGDVPPPYRDLTTETELYCQLPSLMPSVSTQCPFGPANSDPRAEEYTTFSETVYTPECSISRGSVREEFEVMTHEKQQLVPVLSTAVPVKDSMMAQRISQATLEKQLLETLTAALVVPVLKNPRCTTLIIGAWGCEDNLMPDRTFVATKLAELLTGKLVELVRVGWLYHEVHVAFPPQMSGMVDSVRGDKDSDIEIFRRVFDSFKINQREL